MASSALSRSRGKLWMGLSSAINAFALPPRAQDEVLRRGASVPFVNADWSSSSYSFCAAACVFALDCVPLPGDESAIMGEHRVRAWLAGRSSGLPPAPLHHFAAVLLQSGKTSLKTFPVASCTVSWTDLRHGILVYTCDAPTFAPRTCRRACWRHAVVRGIDWGRPHACGG